MKKCASGDNKALLSIHRFNRTGRAFPDVAAQGLRYERFVTEGANVLIPVQRRDCAGWQLRDCRRNVRTFVATGSTRLINYVAPALRVSGSDSAPFRYWTANASMKPSSAVSLVFSTPSSSLPANPSWDS